MNVPMCLSSWANTAIEDVVAAGQGKIPYAMQLSVVEDPEANLFTIKKAEGEVKERPIQVVIADTQLPGQKRFGSPAISLSWAEG